MRKLVLSIASGVVGLGLAVAAHASPASSALAPLAGSVNSSGLIEPIAVKKCHKVRVHVCHVHHHHKKCHYEYKTKCHYVEH